MTNVSKKKKLQRKINLLPLYFRFTLIFSGDISGVSEVDVQTLVIALMLFSFFIPCKKIRYRIKQPTTCTRVFLFVEITF